MIDARPQMVTNAQSDDVRLVPHHAESEYPHAITAGRAQLLGFFVGRC
jgi:hypothetical protein